MKVTTSVSPLLETREISVSFSPPNSFLNRGKPLVAVKEVNFALNRGESLGIVGESGCGKSTIARVLAGIQKLTSGKILFKGEETNPADEPLMQSKLQMVFQDPFSSLNPRMKTWRAVTEPLRGHGKIRDASELKRRAKELLLQVGLAESDGEKYPHQFSGGQRQRVAIARALALNPEILLADEPTASLDVNSQEEISLLLNKFVEKENLTLILISHDLTSVRHLTKRVVVLYMGAIVEQGPTQQVLSSPKHPYTKALLSSAPSIKGRADNKKKAHGDIPSPYAAITGCPFQSRCQEAVEKCSQEAPALRDIGNGRKLACHLIK